MDENYTFKVRDVSLKTNWLKLKNRSRPNNRLLNFSSKKVDGLKRFKLYNFFSMQSMDSKMFICLPGVYLLCIHLEMSAHVIKIHLMKN